MEFYVITNRDKDSNLVFWAIGGGWSDEIECVRYRTKEEAYSVVSFFKEQRYVVVYRGFMTIDNL